LSVAKHFVGIRGSFATVRLRRTLRKRVALRSACHEWVSKLSVYTPSMSPRVTLGQVALHAGVSQSAASKVFNDRSDVGAETIRKVRQSAMELGYRATPRKMPTGKVQVWVVVDRINNLYAPEVVSGMLLEAAGREALITICQVDDTCQNPAPGTKKWITEAHRSGAQAFVFLTTAIDEKAVAAAKQLTTPLVVVDPVNRALDGVVTVGATNFRGGHDAVDHLISLGHRRIAYVGANLQSTPGGDRLAGYLDALRRAGLEVDQQLIVPGRFHQDDGHAAARLLTLADPPTAVFAASDGVAFGFYDACHELGLRIPDDISVVGFDDALGGELVWPHLTTVRQPLVEMGRHAVRTCVAAARTDRPPAPPVELTTTLVVRGSTGPVPTR
jgi:LacI family transcriptional regulator